MKKIIFSTLLIITYFSLYAQDPYQDVLNRLKTFSGKPLDNVFMIESLFYDEEITVNELYHHLEAYTDLCKTLQADYKHRYHDKDSITIAAYSAIFKVLTDTVEFLQSDGTLTKLLPIQYRFEDPFGSRDWKNTFVSELLRTRKGTCHSLPYLYKMLCDELNVPCKLALAPNHIYIKLHSEKFGWYNSELTSGCFPTDSWLMSSGFIPLEAIQKGVYMDTLSDKQLVGLMALDLAQGYITHTQDYKEKFVVDCCDFALKCHPKLVTAMVLKAEARKRELEKLMKKHSVSTLKEAAKNTNTQNILSEMNKLYGEAYQLGHRQIPEQTYLEWLQQMKLESSQTSK